MEEIAELIEFYLINKDVWKDFINEPRQSKSSCLLTNMEIKINDVQIKTHFFSIKIAYELDYKQKTSSKNGKAVLLKSNKISSVQVVKAFVASPISL